MYAIGLIGVVEIVELHLLLFGLFGSYVDISLLGGSCWVFQDQSGDDELSANTSVTQIVEIPRPSAEARALETEEQWQNKGHQKAHMTYIYIIHMYLFIYLFIIYLFLFIYLCIYLFIYCTNYSI